MVGAALLLGAFLAGRSWQVAHSPEPPPTVLVAAAKPTTESHREEVARYELLQLRQTPVDGSKEFSEIVRFDRTTGQAERWQTVPVPLSDKMKKANPTVPFFTAEGWEPMNKKMGQSMAEITALARDGTVPPPP